jgi:GTP-binding protein
LIDTAGLRRAGKQQSGVEVLSTFKTRDAILDADLILLVIDATVGPSNQDSRIIEMCLENHKALLVVANKMDLAKEAHENARDWFRGRVEFEFHYFTDIPLTFVSAKTGMGIEALFHKIEDIREKLAVRISTSKLNKFFTEVIKQAPSPVFGTENVKFYYLTQTNQSPPSFIAFANHPEGVTPAYRRFLVRKIQENWNLAGIPLRIFVMEKGG